MLRRSRLDALASLHDIIVGRKLREERSFEMTGTEKSSERPSEREA
jgi:hypothetical protein